MIELPLCHSLVRSIRYSSLLYINQALAKGQSAKVTESVAENLEKLVKKSDKTQGQQLIVHTLIHHQPFILVIGKYIGHIGSEAKPDISFQTKIH